MPLWLLLLLSSVGASLLDFPRLCWCWPLLLLPARATAVACSCGCCCCCWIQFLLLEFVILPLQALTVFADVNGSSAAGTVHRFSLLLIHRGDDR